MTATLEKRPMVNKDGSPRQKMGRPKRSERDDVTVRLDRTLVAKAKVLAGFKGISVAELLSDLATAPLDREYGQMVKALGSGEPK